MAFEALLNNLPRIYPTGGGWTLKLNADPYSILADISPGVSVDPASLVDAEILIRGVAMTRFNTRGEGLIPRLGTSIAEDLVVVKPAPPPGAVPLVSLGQLQPLSSEQSRLHRVRVVGSVIFSIPGQFLYLQDGVHAVRVQTDDTTILKPGELIEAAGFVDMTREIGMLTAANLNRIGPGNTPLPVDITPEEVMAINRRASTNGQRTTPHDYDGHLIRFTARLLAVQADTGNPQVQCRLLLAQQGGDPDGTSALVLRADLQSGSPSELVDLQPGSEVEVTGIVQLMFDVQDGSLRRLPSQIDLLLRNAEDVVVIRAPSWWTARRLAELLGLVALVLAAAITWSLLLKRQIRAKTRLLTTEMSGRRDAVLEFQATLRERNHLAANLHDTLLQTMGGLGFQLEVCAAEAETPPSPGQAPVHLVFARRMLDHAMDELRNSVWTLRSLPLDGMSLPDALAALARRLGEGRDTRIEVLIDPILNRLPDFIAGNLLLVAQEAILNALKHADPRTITVEVLIFDDPSRIFLTVCDDGRGFILGTQLTPADGHFGLLGMRERIDRLAGTFQIRSKAGKGTIIHAEVPLRAYDEALAERPMDSQSSTV